MSDQPCSSSDPRGGRDQTRRGRSPSTSCRARCGSRRCRCAGFGLHVWAIVLPQVVEGVLAVFVIYRAVSRLASPVAGLVAAGILAAAPATVALDRGNVSDSLLTLLLVLAASATTKAIVTGHWRSLLLAGVWVGLAFQAKMVQAWVVLPALALAYLVAGPGPLGRRVRQVVVAGILAGIVSLAWMTAVTLVPAANRPYADGSSDNSVYSQVFVIMAASRSESWKRWRAVRGRQHDPAGEVLDGEAPERLDEQDCLLVTDGVPAAGPGRLNVELLEYLHRQCPGRAHQGGRWRAWPCPAQPGRGISRRAGRSCQRTARSCTSSRSSRSAARNTPIPDWTSRCSVSSLANSSIRPDSCSR